jgi:hypothetical protein
MHKEDSPHINSLQTFSINPRKRLLQILATSSSPKEVSKNEQERKMGEMGEIWA